MSMEKVSGAIPALALRVEPVPVSLAYATNDRGYELAAYIPRFMNRLADTLALAVFFGLLPVSVAVWKGWL